MTENPRASETAVESLPLDVLCDRIVAGRRRGRSILLVRPGTEPGPSSGWVPVEVRRHAFTRSATGGPCDAFRARLIERQT